MSNTPDIRFKGFTESWEQRNVGDFTSVLSASRVHKDEWETDGIPFFRSSDVVSAFKGIDNEKAYISQELYEKLIKSSGKLEKDDILITGGGSIGIPYIVPNNAPLYTKDADLIWIKKSLNHSSRYLYTYFTGMQFRDYISSISHVGTIAHYTIEQVKNTPVLIPNMAEQKAIGDFLLHIDYLIALHQRKCDEMSELKKFMLQKMFPKNCNQFPEIRFRGFTKPWEQCKLEDVTEEFKSGSFISANDIEENGEYPVYGGNGLRGYASTYNHDGEFALIGRQGALCGNLNYCVGKAFFTEHAVAVKAKNTSNTRFLYYLLDKMNLGQYSDQSAQPGLAVGKLIKLENMFPSKQEQEKIGTYFEYLDNLITLHQRKRDELKEFKKFMLQNMFPKKG